MTAVQAVQASEIVGHLIGGRISAQAERTQPVYDPATGTVSREVAIASRATVEEAIATTPISIPVSAQEHDITVVQDESTLCADGIGHMIVEKTFITIK